MRKGMTMTIEPTASPQPDPAAICSRGWMAKCNVRTAERICGTLCIVVEFPPHTHLCKCGQEWHTPNSCYYADSAFDSRTSALLALSQAPPPLRCEDEDAVAERSGWDHAMAWGADLNFYSNSLNADAYKLGYENARRAKEKGCGSTSPVTPSQPSPLSCSSSTNPEATVASGGDSLQGPPDGGKTTIEREAGKKNVDRICSIYRTVGEAMYDEPRERLVNAILEFAIAHAAQVTRDKGAEIKALMQIINRNHNAYVEAAKSYPGIHGESFSATEAIVWYEKQIATAKAEIERLTRELGLVAHKKDQAEAWEAVWKVLCEVRPDFYIGHTGQNGACKAIREMASELAALKAERANNPLEGWEVVRTPDLPNGGGVIAEPRDRIIIARKRGGA